jgi:hypothetical protein
MFGFSNMIKRWDIIITLVLVLLSFLPIAIFTYYQNEKTANNGDTGYVAVITVDNEEVRRVPLTGNTKNEIFDIHITDDDFNTIEVREDRIRIKGATCYDQVCVQMGFISKPGETVVCLPHRLVIEVQSMDGNENPEDEIIIST